MNTSLSKYYYYKALSQQVDDQQLKKSLILSANEFLNNEYLALKKQVLFTSNFIKQVNNRIL
ncbi:hypothetical protein SynBIOSE41_00186 [Synechococcus sp. BIOS-E4-1]|nr:hypothetical protein SynBIOSE41_00186 [Synechococcus sp. BIOS-E4-1]